MATRRFSNLSTFEKRQFEQDVLEGMKPRELSAAWKISLRSAQRQSARILDDCRELGLARVREES